jgi:tetratricopeptide (TPR) repeat protein
MEQQLIFCGICITFILLTGCQSGNTLQNYYPNDIQASEFLDDKYIGYKNILIETDTEIFALSPEMKVMAKSISLERNTRKKATKLLQHFFSPEDINLAYESGANVIASQAFKNQAANCLSLTIMAYAIAQEAKLNVEFQRVKVPEYWVRNGRVNMLTGHINLTVLEGVFPEKRVLFQRTGIEIDFDPFVNKMSFEKHQINKNTVLAMFYNNKAATAMVNGNYVTAYAYLKKAIQVDPLFSAAWGNLGILYRFNGYQQSAIDTYRYAISLNHNNLTAMANLSMLLHVKGADEEAKRLDRYIMRKRVNNPYYYASLGDEKFYQGAYKEAKNHYKKAINLNKNIHEFYFGLAKVYYMLDKVGKAKIYIKKAMANNHITQLNQQYLLKLTILNQKN